LPVLRIEHVALNVADPVAMADWYVAHLGMRIVRRVEGAPHTRFIADAAGRTVVELYGHETTRVPDYAAMDPLEVRTSSAAVVRARSLAATKAGAVAFSRTGDLELGDFADAVILFAQGEVPDDVVSFAAQG